MKKILILFAAVFMQLIFAQMPDISKVWLNNNKAYIGTIGNEKQALNVTINSSKQDKKDDQNYFVKGFTAVDNTINYFSGKITIKKYKDGKKQGRVFGEYEFSEDNKGQHSGILKGKFVFTFKWNRQTQKIDEQYIEFIGDWKSFDGNLNFKTDFKNNQQP